MAMGNTACGTALLLGNILSFIGTFVTFQLLTFVVLLFLVLGGCLLTTASVFRLRFFPLYMGFMQYPLGTGLLLVLLGVLNLGSGNTAGSVVGGIVIGWGLVNIGLHFWLRSRKSAVHTPLIDR